MADEWKADAHEEPDVRTRRVLALVFGFLGFVVLLLTGLNIYYRTILADRTVAVNLRDFPAPRLQPNPTRDFDDFRVAQAKTLAPTTPAGPGLSIDQAMAAVVARGIQAYDPVPGTPPAGTTLANGAPIDGAPRVVPSPDVAPYGAMR